MLEARGLPTVVIALVLPQVEKSRPPRALMVPFILGRPLGEPNDTPFQRRVLKQALGLLERTDGPVILEDFPDDNPSWFDRADWVPAVAVPRSGAISDWQPAFAAELARILPAWDRFKTRFGRTTVGLAGLLPEDWPGCIAAFFASELPTLPLHDTPALALRFLADDIKALYGEAVQEEGGPPSARQIDLWFWRQTVAGQMLIALREIALESKNNGFKTVGGRFFVPAPYLPT